MCKSRVQRQAPHHAVSSHEVFDPYFNRHAELGDNLEASNKQELPDEVNERGLHRQGIHVWVQLAFPEQTRERPSEEERCEDL